MTAPPPPPPRKQARFAPLKAALLYLFVWPLPLAALFALFRGDGALLVGTALPFGLVALAAWLLGRGIVAREQEKPPEGFPKPFTAAALLTGGAAFLIAMFAGGYSPLFSAGFALAAGAGVALLYGTDPAGAKPPLPEGVAPFTADERRLIEQAKACIASLEAASAKLASAEFRTRLDRVARWARAVVDEIERDPRDLRRARKSLTVYLEGAERVTAKYLATHPRAGDQAGTLEDGYRQLLDELERAFAEQHGKLLENDTLDLDVQIEVLTKRLKQEGVM
ncbi:5-bromo-4-chloroindolyl phosphate hydrolysis family protein [Elioraea thermophila]|uniref:5-bromo-4-chloroindolyl phosphate hydrolysis family protein n=1 Tax=Elioraea thermophila TaxID=2185104 RepID=UPI000DF38A32|nr:5-bromo-4-chloroindolyl phosphate hydrolysis family protein [Elioraea thermophila]